jgi:hypothetical protein
MQVDHDEACRECAMNSDFSCPRFVSGTLRRYPLRPWVPSAFGRTATGSFNAADVYHYHSAFGWAEGLRPE